MNIREPKDFRSKNRRHVHTKHFKRTLARITSVLVLAVLLTVPVGYLAYARQLPAADPTNSLSAQAPQEVVLSWPANAQAAVGTLNGGILASTGHEKPVPTASVAKIMVALSVLKQHPLQLHEQGPIITITAKDVQRYNDYVAKDGSVIPVQEGEQITEYQALQAILLPSANNIADMLAEWAYGSLEDYFTFANHMAGTYGMTQTKFAGDASGYNPATVSTPTDLVYLGQAAMQNPVIKEIVSQRSADLPVVGTVYNVNYLLGRHDIIGIKTGNTEEAGGCYLFAAERTLANGSSVTLIGAIMGAQNLYRAIDSAPALLQSAFAGFGPITVVKKDQVIAKYQVPWSASVDVLADQDLTIWGWRGKMPSLVYPLSPLWPDQPAGKIVGTLKATTKLESKTVNLKLRSAISSPTWQWRIMRR